MQRDVRSEITNETSDPEHTGSVRLVVDDCLLHLDAADPKTGTHNKSENRTATHNT